MVLASTLLLLFAGLCGLSNPAWAVTMKANYGPSAQHWWNVETEHDGEENMNWKISNLRDRHIRFCAYKRPPGCPDSRIPGGPNPNEIACSACIAPRGVGEISVSISCESYSMGAYLCNPDISEGGTEGNEGTLKYICRYLSLPTLTQWGLIILTILVAGSGIWLMIRKRRVMRA
jgi:hypothetical protein